MQALNIIKVTEKLPVGTYQLQEIYKNVRSYDINTDDWIVRDQRVYVRIRENDKPLPKCTLEAYIRKDGKQVIKSYGPVHRSSSL